MGLIKRRTRKQRRMHGAALTGKGKRWSPKGMRLRRIDGQAVWVYSHNESQHSATHRKTTHERRRKARKQQRASRRRNRA